MTTYIEKLIGRVGRDLAGRLDKFKRPEGATAYVIGTSKSVVKKTFYSPKTYTVDTTYWVNEDGLLHKTETATREDGTHPYKDYHSLAGFGDRFQIYKICIDNGVDTEAKKLLGAWLQLEVQTAEFLEKEDKQCLQ